MKLTIIAVALALLVPGKHKLEGRWETKPSVNGNVTGVVFKSDSTFDGYVNRKPFVTGKYSFDNEIFKFTDNGCDGKQGMYKVIFFSGDDSLKFQCVEDSCVERKEGMTRLIMGRVK